MLWITKCDCNSSRFHTCGCDICPDASSSGKQTFFVIANSDDKITTSDISINVIAKSLLVEWNEGLLRKGHRLVLFEKETSKK